MTPLGGDVATTFDAAREGRSGIDEIRRFDPENLPCRIAGEVEDEWIASQENGAARRLDKFSTRGVRMMRVAVSQAARTARLDEVSDRNRVGVALGSHGDHPDLEELLRIFPYWNPADGDPLQGGWDIEGLICRGGYDLMTFFRRKSDVATSVVAIDFDCRGPMVSICSACAAGAQAIGESVRLIRDAKADVMVAGGCEAPITYVGFLGFVLLTALVERYETPQSASRPFDRKRNGFVMSEGAGAMILESYEHARARGAEILGEVLGYGDSSDAFRITDMHPRGLGAVFAMKKALEDARLAPDQVEYINAHGTSTPKNDSTETRAIKEVFGAHAEKIPVSSNKSLIGHTIGAAGAVEAILAVEGMRRSEMLPTINYQNRDPKCDLDYVPNETRAQAHRLALSNSFGFGGQNACLCLGGPEIA